MSTQTQARPLFAAKLTPNRSLGRKGLRIVVAAIAVLATIPGIIFFSLGAWPIVGFMGLDVLLIWWALSTSMRDGQRYETVTLWPDQLELKQVDGKGSEVLTRFDPNIVKLVVDRDINEKTTGLHLRTADRDVVIGAFLNNDEKSSFSKVFGTALKRARR
ncbi:DUF2244 domain-containing protein [Devosia sp.]|uniref:DUF2244 domain-containing protein n=1 Tax=Devosia sp. TaxID=1871048 RepID=UPI003A8DC624